MKIRLIQPAQLDDHGSPKKHKKLFLPMLTLPTLAALTPADHDVAITTEYVQDVDWEEDVDLVGITAVTCQAPRAYQVADEFRRRGRRTVMGGIHASARPEEALEHCDAVVIGEAEGVWDRVLRDAERGSLRKIYQSEARPDLSRPMIPRYDLLDYKHYVIPPFARTPLIPIQTARGCPHECDFCSVSRFFGRQIRTKPVRHVIREIEALHPSRVLFADDNIVADPEHAIELFEALRPLKLRWACQMSTTAGRHPGLIEAAARAGCHENYVGIESLNPESLRSIRKGFNRVEEYERFFKRCADVGILAQASLIFGLDNDTPDTLRQTIDTLLSWDVNYIYIAFLTPLPDTRLHQQFVEDRRILDPDWSSYDLTHVVFNPKTMSPRELEDMVWEMFERCYSLPNTLKRVWRFRRQYVRYFPRDMAVEEVFFQLHMRKAARRRMHPFSLGQ